MCAAVLTPLLLLLLLALLGLAVAQDSPPPLSPSTSSQGGPLWDPCASIGTVSKGDPFVLGLVLIPGANATEANSLLSDIALAAQAASSQDFGVCSPLFKTYLAARNARVAVFRAKIDRLQVLRLPYADVLIGMINASPPSTAAIAFRGTIASTPVYLAKAFIEDTKSPGAGFVISLALLVKFEQGVLKYLQWYDQTCDSCGGIHSQLCIQQLEVNSCATALANCTCSTTDTTCNFSDSKFDVCSTAINVGWSGTDKSDTVFKTGSQIQRVSSYSLVSLYYFAQNFVTDQANYVYNNIQSQWSDIQSQSNAQYTEFGSSTGRRMLAWMGFGGSQGKPAQREASAADGEGTQPAVGQGAA